MAHTSWVCVEFCSIPELQKILSWTLYSSVHEVKTPIPDLWNFDSWTLKFWFLNFLDSFLHAPELYSWVLPRSIPDLYQFIVCDCKSQFLKSIFPHLKSVVWFVWSYQDKVYTRSVTSSFAWVKSGIQS